MAAGGYNGHPLPLLPAYGWARVSPSGASVNEHGSAKYEHSEHVSVADVSEDVRASGDERLWPREGRPWPGGRLHGGLRRPLRGERSLCDAQRSA
eukprot:8555227-Pyramimonas_sp.AAC.1